MGHINSMVFSSGAWEWRGGLVLSVETLRTQPRVYPSKRDIRRWSMVVDQLYWMHARGQWPVWFETIRLNPDHLWTSECYTSELCSTRYFSTSALNSSTSFAWQIHPSILYPLAFRQPIALYETHTNYMEKWAARKQTMWKIVLREVETFILMRTNRLFRHTEVLPRIFGQ